MNQSNSSDGSNILLYETEDGQMHVRVRIEDETVWLSQKQIAELFEKAIPTIHEHIDNIFEEGELSKISTIRKFRIVQTEGERQIEREVEHYNLDVIISVGYRVKSLRGTQFRQWATQRLREYIIKGFTMDDERLKQGKQLFGQDYFEELLERIRAIRASERRIWQKVTDIFVACSIDYDSQSETTRMFYASVQNKFHFAITGKTAAEIIVSSADATKTNMGLTTWKRSPEGRILKSDALVAKNYLQKSEIKELERLVSMYFDYIEGLIAKGTTFTMQRLSESINKFLEFNEYRILTDAGSVSHEKAQEIATSTYKKFSQKQENNYMSDFDKTVQKLQSSDSSNPSK